MKIHCLAAGLVIGAGFCFHISMLEWILLLLTIAVVMVAEIINTAIEYTVDLVTSERSPLAGRAKDAAAGAVLLAALFSVVIGILIFGPRLLSWLFPGW